ncbi:RidA family protein [Saccharothrix syringae]|uniref:RidA family protein n=1 Tax=Saccharothrix syringae TaxID=103733 RepID=UPI000A484601|nr:Rid family hydrolase [Saccharothrix syringae]
MTDGHSDAAEPAFTLGPYSPATRAGNLVFTSAQSGVDPATNEVPPGGFEAECRQAFANLSRTLKAAGAELAEVVKMTVLYTDLSYLPVINEIFTETFPDTPPARTAAVVRLAGNRRIAIDAIAATS